MASPPDSPPPAARRPAAALIGVGVLVVALGFGLPRLAPDVLPDPKPAASEPAPVAPAAPVPVDGPGVGVSLARLAGSLVVVCGLCVAVTRLIGRRPAAPKPGMEVIASLPVDARCAVYLVRAGDRRLLVGLDAGGVKALVELPGPGPLPETPASPAEPAAPAGSVVVGPVVVPADPPTPDEIADLIARLRKAA
ncbi:MAG: hypothetical protein JWO38_6416 [Gemmataceae bacterium]|nr:hypothetical protein [Gemmataceae bacterium]